jgi:hypothetical protein
MAGILVIIVEYKNFWFPLAFIELAVGRFGKGAAFAKLNAVGSGFVLYDVTLFSLKKLFVLKLFFSRLF